MPLALRFSRDCPLQESIKLVLLGFLQVGDPVVLCGILPRRIAQGARSVPVHRDHFELGRDALFSLLGLIVLSPLFKAFLLSFQVGFLLLAKSLIRRVLLFGQSRFQRRTPVRGLGKGGSRS